MCGFHLNLHVFHTSDPRDGSTSPNITLESHPMCLLMCHVAHSKHPVQSPTCSSTTTSIELNINIRETQSNRLFLFSTFHRPVSQSNWFAKQRSMHCRPTQFTIPTSLRRIRIPTPNNVWIDALYANGLHNAMLGILAIIGLLTRLSSSSLVAVMNPFPALRHSGSPSRSPCPRSSEPTLDFRSYVLSPDNCKVSFPIEFLHRKCIF